MDEQNAATSPAGQSFGVETAAETAVISETAVEVTADTNEKPTLGRKVGSPCLASMGLHLVLIVAKENFLKGACQFHRLEFAGVALWISLGSGIGC